VDGRCLDLLLPHSSPIQSGIYQIVFETKEYFERTGRKSFYPFVQVGGLSAFLLSGAEFDDVVFL